jgi:PAS domain-containing protein
MKQLSQNHEIRYHALFENALDAIFLMDEDIFIECNSQTCVMFRCKMDEIIGKPPYSYSPEFQPDKRNSKEKALEKINAAYAGEHRDFIGDIKEKMVQNLMLK